MRLPTAALTLAFAATGACLAATAIAAETGDAKALAGYTRTGETENCLRVTNIENSRILNKHQILFEMRSGADYLSEPKNCPQLNRNYALAYEVTGSDLCTTTIVKIIDPSSPAMQMGACGLDAFQKLEKKTAAAH